QVAITNGAQLRVQRVQPADQEVCGRREQIQERHRRGERDSVTGPVCGTDRSDACNGEYSELAAHREPEQEPVRGAQHKFNRVHGYSPPPPDEPIPKRFVDRGHPRRSVRSRDLTSRTRPPSRTCTRLKTANSGFRRWTVPQSLRRLARGP